jgi:hypothetical protein
MNEEQLVESELAEETSVFGENLPHLDRIWEVNELVSVKEPCL